MSVSRTNPNLFNFQFTFLIHYEKQNPPLKRVDRRNRLYKQAESEDLWNITDVL
jgi:hypothetical protein